MSTQAIDSLIVEEGLGRIQRHDGTVQTVRGYATQPPAFRIHGGMTALIEGLCARIGQNSLLVNYPVCRIEKRPTDILVSVGELEKESRVQFQAHNVILALPPRLAAGTIWFIPPFIMIDHHLTCNICDPFCFYRRRIGYLPKMYGRQETRRLSRAETKQQVVRALRHTCA